MKRPIRVASSTDMNEISSIMDKGFSADPTATWVMPTQQDFVSLHHRLVELWTKPAFEGGGVHVSTDFSGAAVWYRPSVVFDLAELEKIAKTASRTDRFKSFFGLVDACDKYRPTEPYWELELLAVDPAHQGNGMGAKLLEYGLQICDGERSPVYLESSNSANLNFYERHGFELLAEVQQSGTPKRFPMLRKAR